MLRYEELREQIKEVEKQINRLKGKWSKENKVKRYELYKEYNRLCDLSSAEFRRWHNERKELSI